MLLGFMSSSKTESIGLVGNGAFLPIPAAEVPPNTRGFGSRLVDRLKRVDLVTLYKSRLVAQNYITEGAAGIATKSPTVQRLSQRLIFSLAASMPNTEPLLRDISHAYLHSDTYQEREVYIHPPPEMGFPEGTVLKEIKPL